MEFSEDFFLSSLNLSTPRLRDSIRRFLTAVDVIAAG